MNSTTATSSSNKKRKQQSSEKRKKKKSKKARKEKKELDILPNNSSGADRNDNDDHKVSLNKVNEQNATKKIEKKTSSSSASKLKRARGTASTTPLPPEWSKASSSLSKKSLSPDDGDDFVTCQKECYKGFCWDDPQDLPTYIHQDFETTLNAMNESGLFLYDVVQPGGKRSTLTFVTRTLVGDPGSTYKYLGLRLFSHPWCIVNDDGDRLEEDMKKSTRHVHNLVKLGYTEKSANALLKMGELNNTLINKTKEKLDLEVKPQVKDGLVGSADFTITLINRMEPTSVKKDLKPDNIHGLGKASVSWHKDSGLQDFSSIAVYHTLQTIEEQHEQKDISWKVGLRVADQNSSTPALSVPLPSGACYYLLDDFNHQHEHAVISGSDTLRYSSTHRVARDGSGTYQFIRNKSTSISSTKLFISLTNGNMDILSSYNTPALHKKLIKETRQYFQLMHELEFEWIRMWNIQGQHHADLHPYWHKPIEKMKQTFHQLRQVTSIIITELKKLEEKASFLCEDLFDVVIEAFESRNKQRFDWEQRLRDKVFKNIPKHMRPIQCETFNVDVDDPSVTEVRECRSIFILKLDGKVKSKTSKNQKGKSKLTTMTKKEKKKVASNWQRMKSVIKKKK